jgi:hypothetical protein
VPCAQVAQWQLASASRGSMLQARAHVLDSTADSYSRSEHNKWMEMMYVLELINQREAEVRARYDELSQYKWDAMARATRDVIDRLGRMRTSLVRAGASTRCARACDAIVHVRVLVHACAERRGGLVGLVWREGRGRSPQQNRADVCSHCGAPGAARVQGRVAGQHGHVPHFGTQAAHGHTRGNVAVAESRVAGHVAAGVCADEPRQRFHGCSAGHREGACMTAARASFTATPMHTRCPLHDVHAVRSGGARRRRGFAVRSLPPSHCLTPPAEAAQFRTPLR